MPDSPTRCPRSRISAALGLLALTCTLTLRSTAPLQGAPPASASPTTAEAFAAGATLALEPIRLQPAPTTNSIAHFFLVAPIKARPGVTVAPAKVVVKILCYDSDGDGNIVPTIANVSSLWKAPMVDWSKGLEEITVEYDLPRPTSEPTASQTRKYFGYIVRVYYEDQLQSAVAEPRRLLEQFPE